MTTLVANRPCTAPRKSWTNTLTTALAVARQRRALAKLDPAALDDIGLTQAQAYAESRRPMWDAPDHWCR